MIKHIMAMLNGLDHYGQSESIEIAKGKYELPKSFSAFFKQVKREVKWRRRK
jgi:hypothetical protein